MKKSLGLLILLLLCCILVMPASAQNLEIINPSLEWTPVIPGNHPLVVASYDYGDVVLGESRTATFRLNSIASSEVSVYLIWLTDTAPYNHPDPHAGYYLDRPVLYCLESFCFNPATYFVQPVVMPPGDYRLVDVTFTPLDLGEQSVYLYIRSNDTYPPPGPVAYIRLVGTGINAHSSPEFPSMLLPVTMIIGFLGAVLLIQRTREH